MSTWSQNLGLFLGLVGSGDTALSQVHSIGVKVWLVSQAGPSPPLSWAHLVAGDGAQRSGLCLLFQRKDGGCSGRQLNHRKDRMPSGQCITTSEYLLIQVTTTPGRGTRKGPAGVTGMFSQGQDSLQSFEQGEANTKTG